MEPRYAGEADEGDRPAPSMTVLCPICDEPFVPEHANRCACCGHRFPDGYDVDVVEEDTEEAASRRLAILLGTIALVIAMILGLVVLE